MTTPLWCLVVAAVIPYMLAGMGGYFRAKQLGAVDNREPRKQYAALTGVGARAWAAQQNAWESLGLFTVAVLVTQIAHADPDKTALAAIVFIIARILHPIFYIANAHVLRSLVAIVGMGSCVYMFILAAG